MCCSLEINNKEINSKNKPYLVAELSGNHQQDITLARRLITAAAKSGADAVKIQTYTPDTLTLPVKLPQFQAPAGPWAGQYLYNLYQKAMLPWEWTEELSDHAKSLGIDFFSTPFDESAVDFLEETIDPPAYKIASLEITHIPLLKHIAQTKKPVIMSTGMANEAEISLAINTLRENGCEQYMLLKCVNAYPAKPEDFNLRAIPTMQENFNCPIGLSDHSLTGEIALGAVSLGACFIEKHFVLNRADGGVDSAFSLEPQEFAQMATSVKILHDALGSAEIKPSHQEHAEMRNRRSIYVSKDIKAGEELNKSNVRVIRPSGGLEPIHWENVLGKKATKPLTAGTPLEETMLTS